jgi:hypothetical protein
VKFIRRFTWLRNARAISRWDLDEGDARITQLLPFFEIQGLPSPVDGSISALSDRLSHSDPESAAAQMTLASLARRFRLHPRVSPADNLGGRRKQGRPRAESKPYRTWREQRR